MISLIAAVDRNNAIGYENQLLCKLKGDMKHFVSTTMGKPIIMGYKTFESLGCKPLKGRFNIVLTNSPMAMTAEHMDVLEQHENLVFESLDFIKFMIEQSPEKEFMVIGGAQTYNLFLPMADRVYLTRIHHFFEKADSHFPILYPSSWILTETLPHSSDDENEYPFNLLTFEREGLLC